MDSLLRSLFGERFIDILDVPPPTNMVKRPIRKNINRTVGEHAGLNMDKFVARVHTWQGTNFLTFKEREHPTKKSIYTINLTTMRPTLQSPIQKQLTEELEMELAGDS
jgi:hypothetical protein